MPINHYAIEREEDRLDADLAAGLITYEQYRAGIRDIRDEVRAAAEEDAEHAYRDAMGWY